VALPAVPAPPAAPGPAAERAGAPPVHVAPVDYYAALEQGRSHLRAGDHDAAEAAFQAALSARPDDRVARQNLARARQLRQQAQDPSSARAVVGPRKAP
ncbi:tetratricopeptide repeat protein, partial [Myxococcota bacterium]|nr:tetratricopeptide repeat protein [Myxococcota bacterium]